MRLFILSLLLCWLSVQNAWAQLPDSITTSLDTLVVDKKDSIQIDISNGINNPQDSVKANIAEVKDSLNSIAVVKQNVSDSVNAVNNKLNAIVNKPNDVVNKMNTKTDSVTNALTGKLALPQPKQNTKLDSLKQNTTSKYDSIQDKVDVSKKIDALNTKLETKQQQIIDTLKQKVEDKFAVKQKTDSVKQKANAKIENVQRKVDDKLSEGQLPTDKLPGDLPNDGLPDVAPDLEDAVDLPQTGLGGESPLQDTGIPDVTDEFNVKDNMPSVGDEVRDLKDGLKEDLSVEGVTDFNLKEEIEKPVGDVKKEIEAPVADIKSEIEKPVADIKEEINEPINNLKNAGEVQDLKEHAGKVKEVSNEVGEYSEEISKVQSGDTSGLEDRLASEDLAGDNIKYISDQKALIESQKGVYEAQLKGARELQDAEIFKEKLEEKLTNEALPLMTGNTEVVASAQKNLFAYKRKYREVSSIKKLEEKGVKAETKKQHGFIDRFFLGLDFEIIRGDENFVDVIPYLGYKPMKRLELKFGYSERIGISKDEQFIDKATRAYRGYAMYEFFKGFYASAGYEHFLSVSEEVLGSLEDERAQMLLVGIRKKYKIYKRFYGAGQVYYNFALSGDSPYNNRINLRFGFLVDFRRK
ncbi:hypothetical protein [Fulvivirga sp.]|uniref:hypothetical protein n=1 Tax=Fulvivirga sp. TaxID=1931237 RepID=UPI0032EE8FE6